MTLLHVAQNEEFAGERSMARERLHLDLPLPSNEIDDIARGSEAKPQEGGPQAAPVLGSENGRNEVSSNGGKQLIPQDGV